MHRVLWVMEKNYLRMFCLCLNIFTAPVFNPNPIPMCNHNTRTTLIRNMSWPNLKEKVIVFLANTTLSIVQISFRSQNNLNGLAPLKPVEAAAHVCLWVIDWAVLALASIIWSLKMREAWCNTSISIYCIDKDLAYRTPLIGQLWRQLSGVWRWERSSAALALSALTRNSANIGLLKFRYFLLFDIWIFCKYVDF